MALDDERCCFCRRAVVVREWTARPGWLDIECPVCGRYRVERQFWAAAHFKRARQPVLYRRLARRLAESRDRAEPLEIPFEGWETIAGRVANPEAVAPLIRVIRPGEALRLRALRLRALADTPSAFGSTREREEAFPEDVWHERAARGAAGEDRVTYVAEDGDRWLGMASGLVEIPGGRRLELVGMFVEPAARGRGVGAALVEAVTTWARGRRAVCLYLWVTSTSHAAITLYHRCGFRPTGKEKPLDHTPSLSTLEMVRDL